MDLRFIAVMMAVAIIMDMLGRMAKKRAAERQGPPGEEWDVLEALADGREPPGPTAGEALPARREQVAGGFALWSETPPGPGARDSVEREPVVEPAALEPVIRDRAARPIVVRSREPRPVERRRERAGTEGGLVVRAGQLPARRSPEPELAPPPRRAASPPPAPPRSTRPRRRAAGPEDRLGLGTIGGLRKALVAREVLGPPVALRGEDGERKRR